MVKSRHEFYFISPVEVSAHRGGLHPFFTFICCLISGPVTRIMMQLVEVKDTITARAFIQVNVDLHRHDPRYIRPLDKDILDVFNPKKNKAFRYGTCARWILTDDQGKGIGRIAAFVNKRYKNKGDAFPAGGIGFFDCINNQEAADMLFDVSRHWLSKHGMGAMDGPVNFGERDRWWGLVTEGFQEPLYCMNYNPPYYRSLFEAYGFKPFYRQICFGLDPKKPFSEKLYQRHARWSGNREIACIPIDKRDLEKFSEDFAYIYNKAWAGHGGLKQLRKEQVLLMFRNMKPIMDERIVWFTYYQGQPIGMFVNIPDLNQWFRYLNGKFNWLSQLKFWWIKRTKPCKKFVGLVFGIIPEFQEKGIDAYMIVESAKVIQQTDYTEYEMQWIGDFNPKMINVAKNMGETYPSRVLTTYRYIFDPAIPFTPHPVVS